MNKEALKMNKVFANYLGYKYFPYNKISKDDFFKQPGWRHEEIFISGFKSEGNIYANQWLCRSSNDLKFNSSWDWIMCLWEKIKISPKSKNKTFQEEVKTAFFNHDIEKINKLFFDFIQKEQEV
jgi:hypothetical protein